MINIHLEQIIAPLIGLSFAPILPGVINRVKAIFAGRRGAPLTQAYFDIFKLLKKGAVYSRATTWIFLLAPSIGMASVLAAMAIMPISRVAAPVSFAGDIIVFAYCLGLMRFFTVLAALDTGSSFEGMGASREVQFSALAEPALIVGLAALAYVSNSISFTGIFSFLNSAQWSLSGLPLLMVVGSLFIIFLSENARIPVDDPNTHLELTMIHEVMILDYSGPDLAFVLYSATLKLWILGALIINILLSPMNLRGFAALGAFVFGMIILAVLVGIVESIMARLKLLRVPRLLTGALVLAALAFVFLIRGIS